MPGYIALVVALSVLAAALGIAFERDLVGTLTQHGWGRTVQGVGAALTQLRCGVGGFVIDKRVDYVLQNHGFTGQQKLLNPLGATYPENLRNKRQLQGALDRAQLTDCSVPGSAADGGGHYSHLLGFNGEDAGMGSYALLAFTLFGVNIPGLTYAYFVIVLLSLTLFAISHRHNPGAMVGGALLMVALYLTVGSVLLSFKMPGEFGFLPGIDLKDPRFLGTIGALPLLHIVVTWAQPNYRMSVAGYFVLTLQTAILAFAIHLRLPVAWTILILLLLFLILTTATLWRGGRSGPRLSHWRSPRSFFVLATIGAVLCAANLAASYSYNAFYAVEGDLPRHTFWDGVLQSLEYNPDWKAKYGASVNDVTGDEMPLAAVRVAIAKLPSDQQQQYLQPDGNPTRIAYERFSRATFMDILWHDPAFVLHTFLIVKPLIILRKEGTMYQALFAGLDGWHALIPVLALSILGYVAARYVYSLRLLYGLAAAAFLSALIAWLPNWLVLANELVMFDNFIWGLFLICLVPVVLAVRLARLAERAAQRSAGALLVPARDHRLAVPAETAGSDG